MVDHLRCTTSNHTKVMLDTPTGIHAYQLCHSVFFVNLAISNHPNSRSIHNENVNIVSIVTTIASITINLVLTDTLALVTMLCLNIIYPNSCMSLSKRLALKRGSRYLPSFNFFIALISTIAPVIILGVINHSVRSACEEQPIPISCS